MRPSKPSLGPARRFSDTGVNKPVAGSASNKPVAGFASNKLVAGPANTKPTGVLNSNKPISVNHKPATVTGSSSNKAATGLSGTKKVSITTQPPTTLTSSVVSGNTMAQAVAPTSTTAETAAATTPQAEAAAGQVSPSTEQPPSPSSGPDYFTPPLLMTPISQIAKGPRRNSRPEAAPPTDRPTIYNPDNYNPDGSLRTLHKMPQFDSSYAQAMQARYIRHKEQLSREKELSVDEIFGRGDDKLEQP